MNTYGQWAGTSNRSDRIAMTAAWLTALGVVGIFCWILSDLIAGGLNGLSWSFLLEAPLDAGRSGGIGPILVSTGLILWVCLSVSIPLGLATAILLADFLRGQGEGWLTRSVRLSLDVLAGVPSIVFGLFGYALFVHALGMGYSIWAGGLTLACMVLPIFIRAAEVGLRSVPAEHTRAAAALAMSRSTTLLRIILPGATPGIAVGLVLGIGRAAAETAALLFTSGYVDRMPESLSDSGRSLSIHIYELAMNVPGGDTPAYRSALVLVSFLLIINLAAAWISSRFLHSETANA